MSSLLELITALTRRADRTFAARELGRTLGGERLVIFLRDREVDVLLPAPGFPQTFSAAREWRRVVNACANVGESAAPALVPPEGGDTLPAYGISSGPDVVAIVLGTSQRSPLLDELRPYLPLLGGFFECERHAEYAQAREKMATQSAAHAEALAAAFYQSRLELQSALAEAEASRRELAIVNDQLAEQAIELESQAEELATQAEEVTAQAGALRATNTELDGARLLAEEANKAKSQFLATMSHELRTPLNAIGGHVQLIELGIYGPVTDEQRTALARINRSQRHLLGLINDILNLARIESGRLEYQVTDVPLGDVLAELSPMVEPQLRAKRLHYNVSIEGSHLAVRADREKLRQILLNLLSNAIKFTPPDGSVEVSCRAGHETAGTAYIRVSDSGVGIPDNGLDSIFEPFVRLRSEHSLLTEGTGLGLAISRDLARGMGGDLRARSVVGKGSTFTLSLPTAESVEKLQPA